MKILLSTFLIIALMISFTSVKAKVIFDPATYTPIDSLGQSIDTIGSVVYLRVILNGWNSDIKIPEVTLGNCDKVSCSFKYSLGATSAATLTLDKINGVVQIMDTINRVKNPWGAGTVPSATGIIQNSATGIFSLVTTDISSDMKIVDQIQFFGQEKVSWGPTIGDTIWVGKVTANSSMLALDPNYIDSSELPEGMSVVTIDSTKYLQVIVKGWDSYMKVPAITLKENQKAVCDIKYSLCAKSDSTYDLANITAGINLMDTINRVKNPWGSDTIPSSVSVSAYPATSEFTRCSIGMGSVMKYVHQIQFFGQEHVSWGATTGDTIWIGKIKIVSNDPNLVLDPAQADVEDLPAGISVVTLKSKKYYQVILNGWNSTIFLDPVTLKEGYTAQCDYKYALGATSAATLTLDQINGCVQLMDTINKIPNPWGGTAPVPSSTGLNQSPVTGLFTKASSALSKDMKLINEVQFFGQEKVTWGPTVGDTLWVGKVILYDSTATITFVVDDSNLKTSTGFALKGSWLKASGKYDKNWDGGIELAKFYDDGTHGDKTAGDNKWSVAVELKIDGGTNNWEWGIDDSKGKWVLVGANQKFTVPDTKAQTLTYTNTVSVNSMNVAKIKVYPNPASDMINLVGADVKTVEIYNITGSKVLVSSQNQINISTLVKGTYIVKALGTKGEVSMSKFNKQ